MRSMRATGCTAGKIRQNIDAATVLRRARRRFVVKVRCSVTQFRRHGSCIDSNVTQQRRKIDMQPASVLRTNRESISWERACPRSNPEHPITRSRASAPPKRIAPTSMDPILLVRIDDEVLTDRTRSRITLLIAALIPHPDWMFNFDSRTIAVPLGGRDTVDEGFLAERIRLMVAATSAALHAPTVTVAIATADQLRDQRSAAIDAMRRGRNRVISFSGVR